MHNSRIGTVISLVLVFLAGHSELPTLAIALCLPTIVGVVMTLYFQTQAALLALGRKEANRYLISALILMPIWLVGPLLVPTLVGIEVQNWVRSESRS